MKTFSLILFLLFVKSGFSQNVTETDKVKSACLDYIEGFYEGDTLKIKRSLKPSLLKFGYWKNKDTGKYDSDGQMTFQQAFDYAKKVFEKKKFAKPTDTKIVQVLDIGNHIASAKVTAKWGIDYILLSKEGENWMIEQVLWEGPLEK